MATKQPIREGHVDTMKCGGDLHEQNVSQAGNTGDSILAGNADWTFGGDVSLKFDEHVSKSVPLYHEGHEIITRASDFFLANGSVCYDLGCSTGKLIRMLAERNRHREVKLIGIDKESGMVGQARKRCEGIENASIVESDLVSFDFEKADMIISYYTLQFIRPKERLRLASRIYEALSPKGAFFFFEKVRGPDARFQDIMSALYIEYKLDRGYKMEEVLAKLRSLKGVMEPFSTQENMALLRESGFSSVLSIMKYVCFEGLLAIK